MYRRGEMTSAHQRQTDRLTQPKIKTRAFEYRQFIYVIGDGNTTIAGTELVLQWILVNGFRWYLFQLQDSMSPGSYVANLCANIYNSIPRSRVC